MVDLIVAVSFGYQPCCVLISVGIVRTTTSSFGSAPQTESLAGVGFVLGESPLYVATQWYVPGASGVKLTGPYVESPLTFTVCGFVPVPVALVVQSFLKSVNVIVP